MGNFPGGQYGMAPFLLIIGLPILILFVIIVLFLLNQFKISFSSQKAAFLYIIFYFLLLFSSGFNFNDYGMVTLFIYPPVISLVLFLSMKYLVTTF